jgi:tRNA (guanine-N7-)-methyltransferase
MKKQQDNDGAPPNGVPLAFFGRRKARPLGARQAELYDAMLPKLRIDTSAPPPLPLGGLFTHEPAVIRLEIGFGGGEHLAHEAARYPGHGFIGAEPFINGVGKLLHHLAERGLGNVRIHDSDAALLLDWLPEASLDRVDLLYPDPWPKKRHHKRRFVSSANLDRIARALKTGGEFRFASDIEDYIEWTLALCTNHPAFGSPDRSSKPDDEPYEGWLRTRYEAKAVREGRTSRYLSFRRRHA